MAKKNKKGLRLAFFFWILSIVCETRKYRKNINVKLKLSLMVLFT